MKDNKTQEINTIKKQQDINFSINSIDRNVKYLDKEVSMFKTYVKTYKEEDKNNPDAESLWFKWGWK